MLESLTECEHRVLGGGVPSSSLRVLVVRLVFNRIYLHLSRWSLPDSPEDIFTEVASLGC